MPVLPNLFNRRCLLLVSSATIWGERRRKTKRRETPTIPSSITELYKVCCLGDNKNPCSWISLLGRQEESAPEVLAGPHAKPTQGAKQFQQPDRAIQLYFHPFLLLLTGEVLIAARQVKKLIDALIQTSKPLQPIHYHL